jgi:hypothetical protein
MPGHTLFIAVLQPSFVKACLLHETRITMAGSYRVASFQFHPAHTNPNTASRLLMSEEHQLIFPLK